MTRRFISFIPCSFASRRVGSCTARDLNFRLHLQEFLFGVACCLARVYDSSPHLNFPCARSRPALGSKSSCSMCRQSLRQSASTMRSAAGRHCSFVDSMARQRASRGERVAETSQPGGSRGVCPNFLGGWQCIAYDLDFCMHVSACFCVGTASWLAFGVFCSHVFFACFAS